MRHSNDEVYVKVHVVEELEINFQVLCLVILNGSTSWTNAAAATVCPACVDEENMQRTKRAEESKGAYQTIEALNLGNKLDNTTGLLDLLLGERRHPARLDDAGESRQTALTENLTVTGSERVDDGHLGRVRSQTLALLSGNESPELVQVDHRAERRVARQVEVTHTDLTEVTCSLRKNAIWAV